MLVNDRIAVIIGVCVAAVLAAGCAGFITSRLPQRRRRFWAIALSISAGLLGIGACVLVSASAYPLLAAASAVSAPALLIALTAFGRQAEDGNKASEQAEPYRSLFTNHTDGIFRLDECGQVVGANLSVKRLTGQEPDAFIGKPFADAIGGDPARLATFIRRTLTGEPQQFEFFAANADGKKLFLRVDSIPITVRGRVQGAYCLVEDMTERRTMEEKVYFLAFHDELTGLPNRRQFAERLAEYLEMGRIKTGRWPNMAVVLLNIDRFKFVNDSVGQASGDMLIREVADRIERFVLNAPGTFSGRLGSDSFALFFPYTGGGSIEAFVLGKTDELISRLEKPYAVRGLTLNLTFSVGISMGPGHGTDAETLIKKAETAMVAVKHSGKHQIRTYNDRLERHLQHKLEVENGLRLALQRGEFRVYYQPMIDIRTGRVSGAEALVRWLHPEKGVIPPGAFIPIAEESGLIKPIGEWVLREACRQNKAWQDAGLEPIVVSVNLSMQQFEEPHLVENVDRILKETGLDPRYLDLEITETMAMTAEYTVDKLMRLKELGVRLSMDDFGTGYSSLSYLQRFPIDKLKIDQSFVQDIGQEQRGSAIVSTIVAMAHHLRMEVIAEGVESPEQVEFLRSERCDQLQGYWYSPPLPADQFEAAIGMRMNGQAAADRTPPNLQ
ncbi:putative bifunctional diguanylate cyclase/phosphodiesterase [Paenibacillus thermoaerophilus]|uniref:Bifunctional diguanylate cyclase/phosphodiesterase n=1 Tax=Paenibacillus thermoaerophilus TaxID=1215385 RepID=A0ABW2V1Y0_9BACL|nr:EAL domain-containing protein [Paenibacillus thermoaerophilus]TMV18213.1 EAL domain-containing protein [Paenibacillus thermoaerophilus]